MVNAGVLVGVIVLVGVSGAGVMVDVGAVVLFGMAVAICAHEAMNKATSNAEMMFLIFIDVLL